MCIKGEQVVLLGGQFMGAVDDFDATIPRTYKTLPGLCIVVSSEAANMNNMFFHVFVFMQSVSLATFLVIVIRGLECNDGAGVCHCGNAFTICVEIPLLFLTVIKIRNLMFLSKAVTKF